MNERLKEVLDSYRSTLERKQRLIKRIHLNKKENELTVNETIELYVLEAEARVLKESIEDLAYISKG